MLIACCYTRNIWSKQAIQYLFATLPLQMKWKELLCQLQRVKELFFYWLALDREGAQNFSKTGRALVKKIVIELHYLKNCHMENNWAKTIFFNLRLHMRSSIRINISSCDHLLFLLVLQHYLQPPSVHMSGVQISIIKNLI